MNNRIIFSILLKASLFNDPSRYKNKYQKLNLVLSEIIW